MRFAKCSLQIVNLVAIIFLAEASSAQTMNYRPRCTMEISYSWLIRGKLHQVFVGGQKDQGLPTCNGAIYHLSRLQDQGKCNVDWQNVAEAIAGAYNVAANNLAFECLRMADRHVKARARAERVHDSGRDHFKSQRLE